MSSTDQINDNRSDEIHCCVEKREKRRQIQMRWKYYGIELRLAVILLTLSSLCCFAESIQTITLALTGRVIDYQARPVEGATVVCYKCDNEQGYRRYEQLEQVQTTSDGRFSFQVEKEDSFPLLVAGKPGLALGWADINIKSDLIPTIRLGRPSLFKGTVVDEAGRPVSGAKVRMCLKNEMMSEYTEIDLLDPREWFTTETDARGQFTFDNVPTGSTADFGVEAPGKASIWTFCKFGLSAGEQFVAGRTDIRIVLPPEAHIMGQVVDELTGQGVAGVHIRARPHDRSSDYFRQDPVKTDPNGRFKFKKLARNKYSLRIVSNEEGYGSTTVTLESGQTISDARITLSKGIPFEVIVYDPANDEPVENADVSVTQSDSESGYTTFSQEVTTDVNGLARLYVAPGESNLEVTKYGYGTTLVARQGLRIDPRQSTREEVALRRTARILSGDVLDQQGNMLSGASVIQISFGPRALTDANGQFDTSNTHYFVSRTSSRTRVLARHVPSGLAAVGMLEDPNKFGRPHGRIILKPAYTLTGCVTDPNGKGIPAAYVKLLQGRYRRLITEAATDANGAYCIRSVPRPEDDLGYVITARAEGFGVTQVSQIPFHDDIAKPVHLDPIVLLPANRVISGVVEDPNDKPIAAALVKVYGPRLSTAVGQRPCGKTLTGAQGRFRIAGMCKEPLRIEAVSPPPQRQTGATWAHGGNENVRVVLGQRLIFSESLIGEPLSKFEGIKIDLAADETKDKMMIVCFFDMNQRPSRNCIAQLAKQKKQLKDKRVTVIAVHASNVDENTLNEWVKKNNIPFPVGMVRDYEEQIRLTWGVKSLPWLVLIDRNHVVRAEGFRFNELDEKIKKARD